MAVSHLGYVCRLFMKRSFPVSQLRTRLSTAIDFKSPVILMGSPGCGKTTVGRLLASQLGFKSIDIDNDILESHWGTTVANKLCQIGGDNFIEEEGKALMQFTVPKRSVISLSGSNPMHKEAMAYMKKQGLIVFLDIQSQDILNRLKVMKVNRIVGQKDGIAMEDILHYRQQFYETNYDVRVLCEENELAESVTEKVIEALKSFGNASPYCSTRGYKSSADFNDVVLQGLAQDGGLFIPNSIPYFSIKQWERLLDLSYTEKALRILEKWIHPLHISARDLNSMINTAYTPDRFEHPDIFPVVHMHDNVYTTELFHGPTASFKDAALQLMPKFFSHALTRKSGDGTVPGDAKYVILVATSGDTGGAVLDGFDQLSQSAKKNIKVMVLYPEQGISKVQKHQMTSLSGSNIHVVGIKSDFDFCQNAIKQIFSDDVFALALEKECGFYLSAANSINWGRLLPQVVYHASSYLQLVQSNVVAMGDEIDLCIPTGNFGNILAAYYAKMMGIPFRRLICASNVNNVLTSFFKNGRYDLTQRRLQVTMSPAIDILKSSNLERYLYHVTGGDFRFVEKCWNDLNNTRHFEIPSDLLIDIQQTIVSDCCSEENCAQTIKETYDRIGYVLDPHTAVAKFVADLHNRGDVPLLVSGTAHYAKFGYDVIDALCESEPSLKNDCDATTMAQLTPVQLFREFNNFRSRPKMNERLEYSMQSAVVHKTVLDANINDVAQELMKFVSS